MEEKTERVITVKNKRNYVREQGKVFEKPTLTVPDQTLSIKELLDKHVKGEIIINLDKQEGIYAEEGQDNPILTAPISDFTDLDEIDRYVEETQQRAKTFKEKIRDLMNKKKEEDAENSKREVLQQTGVADDKRNPTEGKQPNA